MKNHPSRNCVSYLEGSLPCPDCMSTDQEIEFWKECYQGDHGFNYEECPTFYDGCNCGGALASENEYLLAKVKELKDTPELDATDAAHPAWWRGNDYGVLQTVSIVNKIMDALESEDSNAEVPRNFGSEELNKLQARLKRLYSVINIKGKTFY